MSAAGDAFAICYSALVHLAPRRRRVRGVQFGRTAELVWPEGPINPMPASSRTARYGAGNWLIDRDHLSILAAPLQVQGKAPGACASAFEGLRRVSAAALGIRAEPKYRGRFQC